MWDCGIQLPFLPVPMDSLWEVPQTLPQTAHFGIEK